MADIHDPSSILWDVRRFASQPSLTPADDLAVAERQAYRLLELLDVTCAPVPVMSVTALLRIRVTVNAATGFVIPAEPAWSRGQWHITIGRMSSRGVRAVVAHQLKHILDDQYGPELYPATELLTAPERRDRAADRFASSLLLPRDWLVEASCRGGGVASIARRFGAPEAMVRLRWRSLGLGCLDAQPARSSLAG